MRKKPLRAFNRVTRRRLRGSLVCGTVTVQLVKIGTFDEILWVSKTFYCVTEPPLMFKHVLGRDSSYLIILPVIPHAYHTYSCQSIDHRQKLHQQLILTPTFLSYDPIIDATSFNVFVLSSPTFRKSILLTARECCPDEKWDG